MYEIFNLKYFCLGEAEETSEELDIAELRSTTSKESKVSKVSNVSNVPPQEASSSSSSSGDDAREGAPGFHLTHLRRLVRQRASTSLENPLDEGDRLKHPIRVQRSCTDVAWLGCFVACITALSVLSFAVRMPGQAESLPTLVAVHDSLAHTCGVEQMRHQPFAFICKDDGGNLNFTDILCLSSCPTNNSGQMCWSNTTQSFAEVAGYATKPAIPHILAWCRPVDNFLYVLVLEYANKVWGILSVGYTMLMFWRLSVPVLVTAVAGLFLSLCYVALLKDYAQTLSKLGIQLIVLVPFGWAAYLWYEHGNDAMLPCVALLVVGICVACCACSRMHEFDRAATCIKLSCSCVLQTPMLHFGPCVVLLFRVASSLAVLCCLITAHTGIFLDFFEHGSAMVRCSIEQREECLWDAALFALWNITWIWIQILFTASWEFAVAYLAAEWYLEGGFHEENHFQKGKIGLIQCCRQCHVWWALFRYHFGTMVKASVFIGILRPVRFVLGSLTAVARIEANPVAGIILCCCGCLVDVYEQYFERLSANAYIEVALSGANLETAAFEAGEVSARQTNTASNLNGTTFIFQLVGLALIWWAGYFIMWMIVSGSCPGLREYGNINSPHYIGHRGFWSNAGGLIALVAAFPAMMVFDVASDTILYCAMVDIIQNESTSQSYWSNMPRGVVEFIDLVNGIASWSIFSSSSSESDQPQSFFSSSSSESR